MNKNPKVAEIREFNRFYTNILGLLDRHILASGFSLSEARVLLEIENLADCTSKQLSETLRMDTGYLSRILKQFEKSGLVEKHPSPDDRRSRLLRLTGKGKKAMTALHKRSDAQIGALIGPLPESQQSKLVRCMALIKEILTAEKRINPEEVGIRHKLVSGDIGYLIHMHGWIYRRECRYPLAFEGYVARTFHEFMKTYDAGKDRIWLAEHNGEIVGSIGIVGHPGKAQLRWFLLNPDYRGIGLGKRLLREALAYCRRKRYPKVFLLTTEDQTQAIAMYRKAGFVQTAENRIDTWVNKLVEYAFELDLTI